MITILKQPPAVSLAGNPILFEFKSDEMYSGATPDNYAKFLLRILNEQDGLQDGSIIISTQDKSYVIDYTEGNSLHATLSGTELAKDYSVQYIDQYQVRCLAKDTGTAYNIVSASFVNNYISITEENKATDLASRAFFRLKCQIWARFADNTAKLLGSDYLTPDTDGVAEWDVADYFKHELKSTFDYAAQLTVYSAGSNIVKYYVRVSEYDSSGESGYPVLIDDLHAMWGGVGTMQQIYLSSKNSSWFAEYNTNALKPFLTHSPLSKTIDTTQQEKLYYLHTSLYTQCYVRVTALFDDETTDAKSVGFNTTEQNKVYALNVGYTELMLGDFGKKVVSYAIAVEYQGHPISETRTYTLDYSYYNKVRYLYFVNSFGGWDTLRLLGSKTVTHKYQRSFAQFILQNDADYFSLKTNTDITQQRSVSASAGFVSATEKEYLQELLLSRKVLEQYNGILRSVLIDTQETSDNSDEFLKSFSVNYTDEFSERFLSSLREELQYFDGYFDIYFE